MISYKKIFHGCIWVLFLSFLVLYFAEAGGYYESVNSKKAYLTNEKIKQFEKDVKAGNKEEASKSLNTAYQRVDKAMKNGLVHKNKAARVKSRLTKLKNEMK